MPKIEMAPIGTRQPGNEDVGEWSYEHDQPGDGAVSEDAPWEGPPVTEWTEQELADFGEWAGEEVLASLMAAFGVSGEPELSDEPEQPEESE